MLAPAGSGGLAALSDSRRRRTPSRCGRRCDARAPRGTLGFPDLPEDAALPAQALKCRCARVRGRRSTTSSCSASAASALGPIALRTALRPPRLERAGPGARAVAGRACTCSTTSIRVSMRGAARARRPRSARAVLVISKSGGTAETMSQYLVVRERSRGAGRREWPRRSALRHRSGRRVCCVAIAKSRRHPDARHSAERRRPLLRALAGGDCSRRRSSASTSTRCSPAPAACVTAASSDAGAESGRRLRRAAVAPIAATAAADPRADAVLPMPCATSPPGSCSSGPRASARCCRRRRAMSVRRRSPRSAPPTSTAQVQLFMEGPHDKTVTFIAVEEPDARPHDPGAARERPELAYLGGHSLRELLRHRAPRDGRRAGHARAPELTLQRRPSVDAWHLGGLIMLFELATVYAGAALRRRSPSTSPASSSASSSPTAHASAAPAARLKRDRFDAAAASRTRSRVV